MTHKLNLLKTLTEKRDDGIKFNRTDRRLLAKLERSGLKLLPAKD